jgi:hypothetical protein
LRRTEDEALAEEARTRETDETAQGEPLDKEAAHDGVTEEVQQLIHRQALDEDELEKVGGGYVFDRGMRYDSTGERWEVIEDKTGMVLERLGDEFAAADRAEALHQSRRQVDYDELANLRGIEY